MNKKELKELSKVIDSHIRYPHKYLLKKRQILAIVNSLQNEDVFYHGKAYRVLFHRNYNEIDYRNFKNICWSKNRRGLKEYMYSYRGWMGFLNKTPKYKVIESNVEAIDLNKLIKFLTKKGQKVTSEYESENEILVYSMNELYISDYKPKLAKNLKIVDDTVISL